MLSLPYGDERIDIDLDENSLVPVTRQAQAAPVADSTAALRDALERPVGFPPCARLDSGRSRRPGRG